MFAEVHLYFFDELIKEHLHDCEIIFKFLHYFISHIIVDEQFVLLLGEGLAVYLALLQPDVRFVSDHTLPLRQHQNKHLCLLERDIEFVHGEAVMDFEGEVVEKHCFVTFE
jgi:hypothetical protein